VAPLVGSGDGVTATAVATPADAMSARQRHQRPMLPLAVAKPPGVGGAHPSPAVSSAPTTEQLRAPQGGNFSSTSPSIVQSRHRILLAPLPNPDPPAPSLLRRRCELGLAIFIGEPVAVLTKWRPGLFLTVIVV